MEMCNLFHDMDSSLLNVAGDGNCLFCSFSVRLEDDEFQCGMNEKVYILFMCVTWKCRHGGTA
jgi:hypothetical protein